MYGVLSAIRSVVVSPLQTVRCTVIDAYEALVSIDGREDLSINVGDVIHDGERLYGDGVNVASRVEALAEPGGICITSIVNESIDGRVNAVFTRWQG